MIDHVDLIERNWRCGLSSRTVRQTINKHFANKQVAVQSVAVTAQKKEFTQGKRKQSEFLFFKFQISF